MDTKATPRVTSKLYFWTGRGKLETAVKDWQRKLREVFDLAGVSLDNFAFRSGDSEVTLSLGDHRGDWESLERIARIKTTLAGRH